MSDIVKIVVTVPADHADKLREAIGAAGGGSIDGNYSFCSFTVMGTGRFKPNEQAHPFVGEIGKLNEVEEERVEITCNKEDAARIVKTIRDNHPYEEPVIDVYQLLSL
jgi:hypothetical protein